MQEGEHALPQQAGNGDKKAHPNRDQQRSQTGRNRGGGGGATQRGGQSRGGKPKKWEKLDTTKIKPWANKEQIPAKPLEFEKPSILNPDAPVFVPKNPANTSAHHVQVQEIVFPSTCN